MVLSETRHGAGLTLLQVLRRGLELGECLGPTADRANWNYETALRTLVPVPQAVAEGTSPRRLEAPALARWRRQLGRIVALSFLPESERERRELAGERQTRQFLPRAASHHAVVEILQRAGPRRGRRRRAFEDIRSEEHTSEL